MTQRPPLDIRVALPGVELEIRCLAEALSPLLEVAFGSLARNASPDDPKPALCIRERRQGGYEFASRAGGAVYEAEDLPGILNLVEEYVAAAVSSVQLPRLCLHAGAVAFGERTLLLLGPTRQGKSSLVTALVAQGAQFLCDDLALIERSRVFPYPIPIGLKEPPDQSAPLAGVRSQRLEYTCQGSHWALWKIDPRHLEGGIATGPRTVSDLVFLVRRSEHRPGLRPMPRALAAAHLAASTFRLRARGQQATRMLGELLSQCGLYELTVTDLAETAAAFHGFGSS